MSRVENDVVEEEGSRISQSIIAFELAFYMEFVR